MTTKFGDMTSAQKKNRRKHHAKTALVSSMQVEFQTLSGRVALLEQIAKDAPDRFDKNQFAEKDELIDYVSTCPEGTGQEPNGRVGCEGVKSTGMSDQTRVTCEKGRSSQSEIDRMVQAAEK